MTKLTYSLSNRQRKELLVRGRSLQIAIPIGPDEDPVDFAKASLPEDADWITQAKISEVMCCASNSAGMPKLLGQILTCDYESALSMQRIPLYVAVVVATLTPPKHRGSPVPIQWPGKAFVNGQEIEFVKSEEPE